MTRISIHKVNDSVFEQLLFKLKDGTWKSGDKLPSESQLCEAFGVSRVSVRSALQRLKGMGLIEVKQGKGSFVNGAEAAFDFSSFYNSLTLSRDEMFEIDDIRKMVENKAIEILASKRREYNYSHLTEEYEALKAATAKCDYEEFTKHDHLFHIMLVAATENSRLIQIVRLFQDDYFQLLRESNKFLLRDEGNAEKTKQYFESAFYIHEKIYKAIISGDTQMAVAISKSHAELNEQRFGWYFINLNKE